MAKVRAGVTVDYEIWTAAKKLFEENPGLGSISSYMELSLAQLLSVLPPLLDQVKKGNKEAVHMMLQLGFNTHIADGAQFLNTLYTDSNSPLAQPNLFEKKVKKGNVSKKKTA
jgi:hypothetical protein